MSLTTYCFACLGAGRISLLFLFKKNNNLKLSAGTEAVAYFLFGQGLLANFWVLFALAGNFSPTLVKGVIAIFCSVGVVLNYKLLCDVIRQSASIWRETISDTRGWRLLILSTVIVWLAWITSIGRHPIADGSGFYLALAKVISASEHLAPLPGYENLTSIGLQGEMHSAALITLVSPEAIQLFSWLTLTSGCVFLLALGRQVGLTRHGQWLALAMVFTSSALIELSGSGKTDVYATAMAFAAYYWAFNIRKDNWVTTSILTGAFSGLAVVAKISYVENFLPSLAIILAWQVFAQSSKKTFSYQFRTLALIGASAIFMAMILPIKNQVLFENPLAPYGMKDISDQSWYGPDTIRRIFSLLPLALTFGDHWAQIGNISPLVLAYLPLLLFLPKSDHRVQNPLVVLGIATLIGLASWFLSHPAVFAPRYFLGCLLLLVLPSAKAADHYSSISKTNDRIIVINATLVIFLIGVYYSKNIFLPKQTYNLLLNSESVCKHDETVCFIESTVNTSLQVGERLFMNGSFRYWLRPDLIQCALSTSETENYLAIETTNQRWGFIVGRGFRSVLVANRLTPLSNQIRDDLQAIPDWLDVKIEEENLLIFLRLIPIDDSHPSLYECGQSSPPAWDVFEVFPP